MGRAALLVLLLLGSATAARAESALLDDFEDVSRWTATASEGTHVSITQERGRAGMALRVGYDLNGGGGWIIVRRPLEIALPDNYAFTFWIRGEGRPNNFEFKLIDARDRGVWWRNERNYTFPSDWQEVRIRKSRIALAWGARHELEHVDMLELAVSVGEGGRGAFWIDDLALEQREPAGPDGVAPLVSASTSLPDQEPALVLDESAGTRWRSEPLPREQWLLVDLQRNREFGRLVIDWDPLDYATAYQVELSSDGERWTTAFRTTTGRGGRSHVYTPDAESRLVRIVMQRSSRGRGYGIGAVAVKPLEFSASPNDFFQAIARDAPAGSYPKYFVGRQTYWTVVGAADDDRQALLNEEGMVEVDRESFSIEPFLFSDHGLLTWADVKTVQSLEGGYLPIPSTAWEHPHFRLTVTAFASPQPGRSTLYVRYRVENLEDHGEPVQLFLVLRPFQVNPPWQALTMTGGVTRIGEMRFDGRTVWVNRDRPVVSLTPPDEFGANRFEQGAITDALAAGRVPPEQQVSDPFGFASGALQYNLYLSAHGHAEVDVAVPFHELEVAAVPVLAPEAGPGFVAERQEEARRFWERRLGRVELRVPPAGEELVRALRTSLAYILVNRDGPAIHPGARNYARAWIRDGAVTSAALLEMGFTQEPREFLRWYATFQGADGKVPCCIDRRGADPVPEHDSAGAFIYGIAEYYRHTRDVGFVDEMWPRVVRAVDYLAALRKRRTTDEYRDGDKELFHGLLPESISHEGYSARPVHSYWDGFFALRGLKDAAALAVVVGDDEHAERWASLRDAFRESLYTSIARAQARHGIDFIPGSAELGDFDPTSTSIAVVLAGEERNLPEPALTLTFDRYWSRFQGRLDGDGSWQEYSPYEMRNVETFLRLGQKARALELLAWLLADRRPRGWNVWAEISWRDPEAPHFIGDMPHGWIAASFVSAVRSLFAFEREADQALVVGAGIPAAWATHEVGVTVKRLPTHFGVLSYTLGAEGADAVRVRLSGDLALPPGKIVVRSPLDRPLRRATVNGRAVEPADEASVVVAEWPADVLLGY
jgi:hypothetical protein